MESSFSPGRSNSPRSSFGGRSGRSPPLASFNVPNAAGASIGGCSRSPPSIVGFNPPPAHAQSVGVAGGVRSDAGREILSILSARREEQARSWLGTSPPARAANPMSNDCRFHRREGGEALGAGNPGGGWNQ